MQRIRGYNMMGEWDEPITVAVPPFSKDSYNSIRLPAGGAGH